MTAVKIEKEFLERLQGMQTDFARQTLEKPSNQTEFGFGEASGKYQGLRLAEQLFLDTIGEEDDGT